MLDYVQGEFLNAREINLYNKFSGRDFAQVIQPGDTLLWREVPGEQHEAKIEKVSPLLSSQGPAVSGGARITIEPEDTFV